MITYKPFDNWGIWGRVSKYLGYKFSSCLKFVKIFETMSKGSKLQETKVIQSIMKSKSLLIFTKRKIRHYLMLPTLISYFSPHELSFCVSTI